jgi:hypothetical protein
MVWIEERGKCRRDGKQTARGDRSAFVPQHSERGYMMQGARHLCDVLSISDPFAGDAGEGIVGGRIVAPMPGTVSRILAGVNVLEPVAISCQPLASLYKPTPTNLIPVEKA